jgi:hypothetical protein
MDKLRQFIREEILKEIKINTDYIVASPEYKKFYQMVALNNYWDVDWEGGVYSIDFNYLNEFDLFYFIYSYIPAEQWQPDMCTISKENLENGFTNWGIEDDPAAQKNVIDMIIANR